MSGERQRVDSWDAIRSIVDALKDQPPEERERILQTALTYLGDANLKAAAADAETSKESTPPKTRKPVDISSLKTQKDPRHDIEMAVVAAYYVSELAPSGERADSIDTETAQTCFRQAKYRLPASMKDTLRNAMKAGYLDSLGGNTYKLNPVGYNLVEHNLPHKTEKAPGTSRRGRKPKRKKGAKGGGTAATKRAKKKTAKKKKKSK